MLELAIHEQGNIKFLLRNISSNNRFQHDKSSLLYTGKLLCSNQPCKYKLFLPQEVYDTVRVREQSDWKGIYSTTHALWHQVKDRFTLPLPTPTSQGKNRIPIL